MTKLFLAIVAVFSVSPLYAADWWKPEPGLRMHIQYEGTLDTNLDVDVYNIDLVDTTKETIAHIKANGKHVICYFSAGSSENWRPDFSKFPASVKGKNMDDWVGEKWLDVRKLDILMPIMNARMDLAKLKGCDAIDPDNVDGWDNSTGFPIKRNDQKLYLAALSKSAHDRGLAIGMKNNPVLINEMFLYVDFGVIEECHKYNECDSYRVLPMTNKPAWQIEYGVSATKFCPPSVARDFDAQRKKLSLNATTEQCR